MFDGQTPKFLPLVLATALLAGCQAQPPALEVDSMAFSEEEIRGLGPERIDELVRISSVGLAVSRGEVERLGEPILARRTRSWQVDRLREEVILEAAGTSEEELEARYRDAPDHELEVRHLVVMVEPWEPEPVHREARATAQAALEEIRGGADFAEVAGRVSDEPGADRRGGLLSPGREGTWVTPFWEAAMALEEGEVSEVVETEYGYHVLKLEERHDIPFDEARTRVVRELAGELGGGEAWDAHRGKRAEALQLGPDGFRVGDTDIDPEALEEHLASLPARSRRALSGGSPDELRALLEDAALHLALAREADARGIAPAPQDRAALLRAWERDVSTWASFLGLAEVAEDALPQASLDALRSNDQNARIARQEMAEFHPVLEAAWPVRRPGETEATRTPARLALPSLPEEG
ncbi:MAG: hypothetical protein EA352_08740 [Gemmatimonadales bacterium]|nr:MAG: hypothetical protein EA352_08740 [Gemmatimonadales bacterium]